MVPAVFLIDGSTKDDWLEALLFAVAVGVGLTPKMLPMIITVNLAKGAIAKSRAKVIVNTKGRDPCRRKRSAARSATRHIPCQAQTDLTCRAVARLRGDGWSAPRSIASAGCSWPGVAPLPGEGAGGVDAPA